MAKKKPPTFGEVLKALRESKGLTQTQLADAASTTKTTVYRIETGRYRPAWDTVCALADALGVGVERFRGE